MIEIKLATVFVTYNRVGLRWSLTEDAFEPVVFEVLRSGSQETGFEVVATTRATVHQDRVNVMSKYRPLYYKVRATIGGRVVESDVTSHQNAPNEDVLRLQKRERFQLAKFDGIPAMIYPRRRTGKKCPRCVADGMGNMGNQCKLCFDTGFLKGYYPPLPIWIGRTAPDNTGANLQENYVKEAANDTVWTSNWTDIDPEDVVVEMVPPNNVYRVTGVMTTARRNSNVRQILSVNEADKGSSIYHLPIPDFPWPAREDIFFADWEEPPRDFDAIYFERLDAYVQDQDLRDQDDPDPAGGQPPGQAGNRNPAKGYFT